MKIPTKVINHTLLQKSLLKWYDRHHRDLPWRHTRDPYAIFVSEMMLQQTQVKTVLPYYVRFLKELPNWKSLAKAKEEKVLKLWEGLGYYRRARSLQAAAHKIVKDFGSKLPDTLEEILKIPGVGPYSAGAILSIAYQKPYPVVDGNVIRVYSRLFLLKGNLKSGLGLKRVWVLAEKLIYKKHPGDFNQAVMELGATLCLPENPLCLLCPLASLCQAAQRGLQNNFPKMPIGPEIVEVPMVALLIEKRGRVLVRKRSRDEKWLKGMWEFPSAEGKTFEEALQKLEKAVRVKVHRKALYEVRHQITHHKIRLKLFQVNPLKSPRLSGDFQWVLPKNLPDFPFASAQGKLRKWILTDVYQIG